MPELPEVETIARGLDQRVSGDTIESVWSGSRKQPLKSPAALIASTIEGKRISRVHRAGKHIVFDLENFEHSEDSNKASQKPSKKSAKPSKRKTPTNRNESPQAASLPQAAQWIVHLGMTGRMVVSEPDAEIVKHT